MHTTETQQYRPPPQLHSSQPPTKANLKAWWNQFNFVQKAKRDGAMNTREPYRPHDNADHPVFEKTLKESLKYASVQISTANTNGDLYVWGYIPVVVAKCGLYLKENATEIPGTFRVNGSNKRMRELQAVFETPPRYGKNIDWRQEHYTTHDVASVFRRYLTRMPEPVIPYDMYHLFRDALAKQPFNQDEVIATYKSLIRKMPKPNQYLLLYVLDLLSVFARKSDKNLMTATNLAVIFRPGLISHPQHEMSPQEYALSQRVLEFLIAQQDWFMLDISPPTPGASADDLPRGGRGSGSRHGHGGGGSGSPSGSGHGHGGPSRKGTMNSSTGTEPPSSSAVGGSASWQTNADAGPSHQRQEYDSGRGNGVGGSGLSRTPITTQQNVHFTNPQPPVPPSPHPHGGQLTENITPTSSIPPSPTAQSFERSRSNSAVTVPTHGHSHSLSQLQRSSSPLNPAAGILTPAQRRSRSPSLPVTPAGSLPSEVDELMVIPYAGSVRSTEEDMESSYVPSGGGWKLVGFDVPSQGSPRYQGGSGGGGFMALGGMRKRDKEKEERERLKMMRRRTTMDRTELVPHGNISPIQEDPPSADLAPASGSANPGGATGITRSRTLPSRRKDKLHSSEDLHGAATDKENDKEGGGGLWGRRKASQEKEIREKRVLKKQRRASGQPQPQASTSAASSTYVTPATSPMPTPALGVSRTLGMHGTSEGGSRDRELSGSASGSLR